MKSTSARKTRLAWLLLTLLAAILLALLSPVEQTLGESIRVVYFHGAWVWAGLITFGLAALAGLLGLVLRRGWPGWSLALGRSGLFFWLTYLPMSLWVMQLFWGGFFFDEPRWRMPFTFAVVGVLLQAGLWVLNAPPLLTCLGNLGFGAALWWNTLTAEAILHPESPVFQSNSPRIQVFFAALVLLSLLFGAQLTALLHSRQP
jgi:hypothetical protein